MSRRFLALMAVLLGVVLAPLPGGAASASCAGPSLAQDVRLVLERGTRTSVEGVHFVDGCRDTMSCSGIGGCSRCHYNDPPPKPLRDVALVLRQRSHTWRLDTADAGTAGENRMGQVRWSFEVPRDLRPGRARLVADGVPPVVVEVR